MLKINKLRDKSLRDKSLIIACLLVSGVIVVFKKDIFLFSKPSAQTHHEIYRFNDLIPFIDKETMVICDLDNTVMIPEKYEGSDMWFSYHMKHHQNKGSSYADALAIVLPEYARLQKIITVKPVEPEIPHHIKKWQSEGICVMGLTSRGDPVISETIDLLRSITVHFAATAPACSPQTSFIMDNTPVMYKEGILFCTVADKGTALVQFLRATNIPAKIVFVDDTLSKVISVTKALEKLKTEGHNFTYRCFHYRHLDEHIATLPKN